MNVTAAVMDAVESVRPENYRFAYLYGSHATGETHARSDIDVCFYYDAPEEDLYDIQHELQEILGDKYDVTMFQHLPLYIQAQVFKGDLLDARDEAFVHDIARTTRLAFEDFRPRYEYMVRSKAGAEAEL